MRLRACFLALAALPAAAADPAPPVPGETVVVTATRTERPASRVPASVDSLDAQRLRAAAQPLVNLSESLPALAGVVANNRQNYAQDLQVSVRGFGARSTFGVRGVRIVVDGIPATLPDGQGQVSHIDLASAARVEVLRGPFSVLYGNAAGGVIDVDTQAGPLLPAGSMLLGTGSDGVRRIALDVGGTFAGVAGRLSGGRFQTSGYREHSAATRENVNAKAVSTLASGTGITLVANGMNLEAQDPLGLTRTQWERDPRSVDPTAIAFDTRKTVDQAQAGVVIDQPLGTGLAARVSAYGGDRGTRQYQSIPLAPQASPLHPGGVIDLTRGYAGLDARLTWDATLAGRPFTLVAGASRDRLDEDRRGYQNFVGAQLGVLGALRRDETNRATESGLYAQGEWAATGALRLLAGIRASRVEIASADHYVAGPNPDDSGRVSFRATTPVAGASLRLAPSLDGYVAAGRGFETPTLNELAYRSDGGTGLNTALAPARSDHLEAGLKWTEAGGWRATFAIFDVRTDDEIVVQANAGGRTTFRNAGATRRRGVELQAARDWGAWGTTLSAAWLDAVYEDGFLTCAATPCPTPTLAIPGGNRIPGVPARTAYGELRWRPVAGLEAALEARYAGDVMVNDLNADAAPAHAVVAARLTHRLRVGAWELRPFLRVDNLFDRRYAGSVIVNEGNARYFEPAPGRTWFAGVSAKLGS